MSAELKNRLNAGSEKDVTTADRLVAAATRDDRFYGGADSVAEVAATAPADEGDAYFLPKKRRCR